MSPPLPGSSPSSTTRCKHANGRSGDNGHSASTAGRLFVGVLTDTAKPVVVGAVLGVVVGGLLGSGLVTATSVGGAAIGIGWSVAVVAFIGTLGVAALAGLAPAVRRG